MIKLSFGQNDSPMGQSFWPKESLITHILFELHLFGNLDLCTFFLLTLYFHCKYSGSFGHLYSKIPDISDYYILFGKATQSSQSDTTPRVLILEKTLLVLAPALKENIFAPDLLMD